MSVRLGLSLKWSKLLEDPVTKLSRATTLAPRAINSSTRCDPKNPAPYGTSASLSSTIHANAESYPSHKDVTLVPVLLHCD